MKQFLSAMNRSLAFIILFAAGAAVILGSTAILGSAAILVSCTTQSAEEEGQADLVLLGGTVYTVDESKPTAEAVAVVGNRVAAVGDTSEISRWVGDSTQVLDLKGLTVTPGIIESHGHILGIGYGELVLDLSNARNYDEVVARIAEAVQNAKAGEWIMGRGWHQSKWTPQPDPMVRGYQTHSALSAVSPDNPVFLSHASGHAAMANAKAMELAGIRADTKFPEGGEIIRDEQGNPTGILVEAAQGLVARHIPAPGPEQAARMLELAIQECLENGITSFHDAGSDRNSISLYKKFLGEGKLKIRVYAMVIPGRRGDDPKHVEEWMQNGPEIGNGDGFLTIRAIKLYVDGALGSRGARLLEPYLDDTENSGHYLVPPEQVYQISRSALSSGFQVAAHGIGDRAIREILDQYERVFQENPAAARDHRFRIEHAQHISGPDIPRFARLGVIAAIQAVHMSSDISWAVDRLGLERIEEGAYVWQKLLQSGAVLTNGTDAPVEPVSPVASFYSSISRRTLDGELFPWSHPEQSMTREQALRSYTLSGAHAAFEEDIKGSIEPGKLADFTVFSQDIMTIPEDEILKTEVIYTIIDGKVVYKR